MKNLLYIVLSFFVLTQSAAADDKRVAEELLKGKLESVISVLQTKDLEKDVKKQRIIKIVEPIFDFPLMGKLASLLLLQDPLFVKSILRIPACLLIIPRQRVYHLPRLTG